MAQDVDLGGLNLVVNDIKVGASGPGQSGTSIGGGSETPGTVTASTAVVVDANKDISTFRNLTATNHKAGSSGVAGTFDIFPTTAAKGKTEFTASDNSGNTTTIINTAAQAGTRTLTVPDAGGSTANFVLSTGTSTATTATSTELNTISGVTPGTVIASKALVADSGIKVNGLLNATFGAGTATVAPINLTTGTNLTTAASGAIEFDGTCYYATAAASSRQNVTSAQRVILTADHDLVDTTIASNTPLFVATGAATGAITLQAGVAYEFEELDWVTNTGTTSHTWAILFGGTATFTRIVYLATATTSTGAALTAASQIPIAVATAITVTGASTSATENVVVYRRGTMVVNAGGTVIPSIVASARPGQTGTPGVTVKAGSYFRIWPIGAAATIVTGNWS